MTFRQFVLFFGPFALLMPVTGQEFTRNDISVAFGSTAPVHESFPLTTGIPDLTLAYGFRFTKNVQADVAFDTAFHPIGTVRGAHSYDVHDYLFITQFGARAVLPVKSRLTIAAGGGPAIVHYSTVVGNFTEPFTRWGYYVLASAKVSLDHAGHIYVGSTPKFFGTNGTSLGRFFILSGEFGYRF